MESLSISSVAPLAPRPCPNNAFPPMSPKTWLRKTFKGLSLPTFNPVRLAAIRIASFFVMFGCGLIVMSHVGSRHTKTIQAHVGYGEQVDIGPYRLINQAPTQDSDQENVYEFVRFDLYSGSSAKKIASLAPETKYNVAKQLSTPIDAGVSTLFDDIDLRHTGFTDKASGNPIVQITLTPFKLWRVIGLWVVTAGIFAIVAFANPFKGWRTH